MLESYATACLEIWLELAPWLLLGAGLAGLLHVLVPADLIKRHLGSDGIRSVIKAVLIGTPMPLCSCGVIPTALGLRRDGASKGASLAFLISTPQTGVDSIAVSAAFLGWPFAVFKVVAAVVTGIVGGWLGDRLEPPGDEADAVPQSTLEDGEAAPQRSWRDGVAHADELLQMIGFWLVIGVLASALITVVLPTDGLAAWSWTQGLSGMVVMLLVSMPLYVCATASVPIAAALVAAGLPGGAALVFLMAGPATNVATIGAVYGAFGKRLTLLYVATVVVGSISLGWLFEGLWGVTVADNALAAHDHHGGVIHILAAALLAVVFARHGWHWLKSRLQDTDQPRQTIQVGGMTCGGCANKVAKALEQVPGVTGVAADLETGAVSVYGTVDHNAIEAAVVGAGFTVG